VWGVWDVKSCLLNASALLTSALLTRRQKNALFVANKSPKEKAKPCSVRANAKNGYIAGVSVSQFQDLSTASAPFLCVMCYQQSHGVALEELRATVTALTAELRAALQRVEARGGDALPSPPTENNEPWHTATRRKKRNKKGNNAGKIEAGASAFGTNQYTKQHIIHAQSH